MTKFITTLISILSLAAMASVQVEGDGCYFSEDAVAVSSDQKAVAVKNGNDISLTFSTAYTGNGDDFGWIIPTPVRPMAGGVRETGVTGEEIFNKLNEFTAPTVITEEYAETGSGCFPTGTMIHTEKGLAAIETLAPGDEVRAFDFSSGRSVLSKVSIQQPYHYKGVMITIRMGSAVIEATGNHTFRLAAGDHPDPRWVEAQSLKAGDLLTTINGMELYITELSSRQVDTRVHHLEVERYHNYAVHAAGIIVHNGGKQEPASGVDEKAEPLVKVYETLEMENYQASILGASKASALYEWLAENNYKVAPDAEAVLESYIARGWFFTAVKMKPETKKNYENEFLSPITINYMHDKLVFPLHISSISTVRSASITLYVIAESTVSAANVPTSALRFDELSRDAVSPESYIEASILRTMAGQDGGGLVKMWGGELPDYTLVEKLTGKRYRSGQKAVLTRLETRLTPELMTQDLILSADETIENLSVTFKLYHRYGLQSRADKRLINTALRGAAQNGETEAVSFLLHQQADVNTVDDNGRTPLMAAVLNGYTETANLLLYSGADVNLKDLRSNTALIFASGNNSPDLADRLIQSGADVNAVNSGNRTPALQAVLYGQNEILEFLIKAGADINYPADDKGTALIIASRQGNRPAVKLLLEAGADVNAYSGNCLTPAGYISTGYGWTPLYAAVHSNDTDMLNLLLQAGADIHKKAKNGAAILHMAAEYGYAECISVLTAAGAEVNARDSDGDTALHTAASKGKIRAIRILLDNRADPTLEDRRGRTPLEIAELKDFVRTAELLRNTETVASSVSDNLLEIIPPDTEAPDTALWSIDSAGFRRFYTDSQAFKVKWYVHKAAGSFQSRMETVETKVTRISGYEGTAFGIVFCFINHGNFYNLHINTEGEYKISKHVNGRQTTLINWTESDRLNRGYNVINVLKVKYAGNSSFEYSFNGIKIGSFVDTAFVGGHSGYYARVSEHDNPPEEPVDLRFIQLYPEQNP